eukprot:TRINITY_DN25880_c0_g1_i1.p2 TRINITY_DN25880_c0_g1~~TRINITY_DN25880_c0_g1_i1.p2  ORF type:complete len:341 (+),score=61.52 TRINITY_DN25880_c0_g1_i1:751-1773(+)
MFTFYAALGPLASALTAAFVPFPAHPSQAHAPAHRSVAAWHQWIAIRFVTAMQISADVGLVCNFGYADIDPGPHDGGKHDPRAAVPFLVLCAGFYVNGYFSERWRQGGRAFDGITPGGLAPDLSQPGGSIEDGASESHVTYEAATAIAGGSAGAAAGAGARRRAPGAALTSRQTTGVWRTPSGRAFFSVGAKVFDGFAVLVMFLTLAISSPIGEVEDDHYIYPIYSASYREGVGFGAAHVMGTWAYIGIAISLFQAYGETVVSTRLYEHTSASTIVVYIFHWVFVKMFVFWVVGPCMWRVDNIWVGVTVTLLTFACGVLGSLAVYDLLRRHPSVGRFFGL